MARRPISLSLRFSVYERDKYTCQYCGRKPPEIVLNVDHVQPVALGGDNRIDNLLTACRDCNSGKGARDPGLAMPSRPLTYGERRAVAKDEAQWWAELALYGAAPAVKALMWQLASKAEEDGVLLILPLDDESAERDEIERLLRGMVAVGAVRTKGRGTFEWWMTLEQRRGVIDNRDLSWSLGSVGPIPGAPSVAEVYG